MADEQTRPTVNASDYEAIEAAVMETVRGRWFLKEYARRNRNTDTQIVLDAIETVSQGLRSGADARSDIATMVSAMREAKSALKGNVSDCFADPLDAIPEDLQSTTHDLRRVARELAGSPRSVDGDDSVARHAARIEAVAALQDDVLRRVQTIIQTLRYLETRIHAMMSADETPPRESVPTARSGFLM